MTVALRGNLRDFGIGEVFQLIGQQRKTGVLEIDGAGTAIHVCFAEGAVVAAAAVGPSEHAALGDMLVRTGLLTADRLVALERQHENEPQDFARLLIQQTDLAAHEIEETEDLVTRETIFTLLHWTTGSFHFSPQSVAVAKDASRCLPAEQILMDGLRMVDEWRSLDPAATDETTVFQRTGRFETYREHAYGDSKEALAAAERMLLSVNGRLPVRRLIDLSRLGSFEGARLLSGLRGAGVIEPLDPDSLPRARRWRRGEKRAGWVHGALLGGAPFAALLLAVALLLWLPAPPAPSHYPVLRDPLRAARIEFETRRLRNLVEAHRYLTGAWPADLGELVDRAWVPAAALAADGVGPYYYARRSDEALVLAPER